MSDAPPIEEVPSAPPVAEVVPVRVRRDWRRWISAALFLLTAVCFAFPFASTSCTLPGGYGRGVQGTSTVYRGVDLAFDAVPAVNPPDRTARPESLPNEGQLGPQPLLLLALLAAVAGIGAALVLRAVPTVAHTALTVALLVIGQWAAITAIAGLVGGAATLPAGKSQTDYVNTGPGFLLAAVFLLVLAAINLVAIGWDARRSRSPA